MCAGEKKLRHQLLRRRRFFPKLLPTFALFSRQNPRPSKVADENVIIAYLAKKLRVFVA